MIQPTLFLMVGYPGSGKTTTAAIIHRLTGAEHLWADHERKKMFVTPTYTHAENLALYARLNGVAEQLLREGNSVIFDTNFNFYSDRQKLRRIAARQGARAVVVWVRAPKDLARERATRDAHKQHTRVLGDMSAADFNRMAGNLQAPRTSEQAIELDGTTITAAVVARALERAGVTLPA